MAKLTNLTYLNLNCICDEVDLKAFINDNWDTTLSKLTYFQPSTNLKLISPFNRPHNHLKTLVLCKGVIRKAEDAMEIASSKPRGFTLYTRFGSELILKELYRNQHYYLFFELIH